MRLFSSYNHIFSSGKGDLGEIYEVVKDIEGLSGLWISDPAYVETSGIGIQGGDKVRTWNNYLEDGNYLYSEITREPSLIVGDSQFNGYPSIDFSDSTNQQLLFKFPLRVKTIVIVYLTRVFNSYIFYAPRRTLSNNPNEVLYYDAFTPGLTGQLWASESLDSNSVSLGRSRINSRDVLSNVFVPLGSVRVLSVSNFGGDGEVQGISGIGGAIGDIGGSNIASLKKTFRGRVAAIVGFNELLSEEDLIEVERVLGEKYINYDGPVLIENPYFRGLVGDNFSFNFNEIVVDEWYDISSYELLYPLENELAFNGSVLSSANAVGGVVSDYYEGEMGIRVINSVGLEKLFQFRLELVHRDPIVNQLPQLNQVRLVLSSWQNIEDGEYGGIYTNSSNGVLRWDDARRVLGSNPKNNRNRVLGTGVSSGGSLEGIDSEFNGESSVRIGFGQELLSATSIEGRTFLWVYLQEEYGNRNLLDSFPDIKGNGELWTVANTNQVHGNTAITRLVTKVQKIGVNTLSYRNKLNRVYFIVGRQTNNESLSFRGLKNLRGRIVFFCSWSNVLTDTEVENFISVLAPRYYDSLAPYIFSEDTEYRTQANITVDLKTKVSDLNSLSPMTYEILQNHYSGSINSEGILSFTGVRDEVLRFRFRATDIENLVSEFEFDVDITLKTNPLYIDLRELVGTSSISLFLIPESDSYVIDSGVVVEWSDYREVGIDFIGTGVTATNLYQLDNRLTMNFDIDGSDYFSRSGFITGRCFVIVYVKKEGGVDRSFLLGQSNGTGFASGLENRLFDNVLTSSSVLNGQVYVNGKARSMTYQLVDEVMNVIVLNTSADIGFDQIARDRMFNDRSVKGYIPLVMVLNRTVSIEESNNIYSLVRDYYDSAKFVVLLHFDNNLVDSSIRGKVISGVGVFDTSRRFGSHSLRLVTNSVCSQFFIENRVDLSFLTGEWTISFWIRISNSFSGRFEIYSQSDLWIFIESNTLYISRTNLIVGELLSWVIPNDFYGVGFNHVQINRVGSRLYLFVGGISRGDVIDEWEYEDYNSPGRIGQSGVVGSGINIWLDEFAIYRNRGFNDENFTVPSVPYSP